LPPNFYIRGYDMRKEIKFDLFNEGETIYFNNLRLNQFEKAIGRSIMPDEFLMKAKFNQNETLQGLLIGLRHHYPKATFETVCEKVDNYFDETGKGIGVISDLVLKAIVATGIYGKELDDIVNNGKDPAEIEIKNE
jgi:hypothetical protein